MANLETLELTISGSADKASQGIGSLITSLTSLNTVLGKSIGGLMRLNEQLKTLKGYGSIKLPNIGKETGATSVTSRAKKITVEEIRAWQAAGAAKRTFTNGIGFNDGRTEEERRAANPQWYQDPIEQAKKAQLYLKEHGGVASWAKDTEKNFESVRTEAEKTKEEVKDLGQETKKTAGDMSSHIEKVKKSASGLLTTIGRIFKTMLIRTAIRALLKAAKEGLDNYYHYASEMGLAFGSAMDSISNHWTKLKNQLGAAIGSLLSAIAPILIKIIHLATIALNAITAIIALISGKTTYSAATEGMNGYAGAINSAGKAAKQWLASFDELNVMTQDSPLGGGGGGGSNWGSMFEEIELPQWMIEWKPIIEAVLGGVLGALILPKIWDWIKKIFHLFTGHGADNAIDLLHNLLDDDKHFPEQPNYKPFPEQPKYEAFPTQPMYTDFPIAPDYTKLAADWAAFAGASSLASTTLPIVTTELGKIMGLINGFSAVSAVITTIVSLLQGLTDSTIKIKVDRKEYDEFKDEYDKWSKDKKIYVGFDSEAYMSFVRQIDYVNSWLDKTGKIVFDIGFNDQSYASFIRQVDYINSFLNKEGNMVFNVSFEPQNYMSFIRQMDAINAFVAKEDSKYINLVFIDNDGMMKQISDWVATPETKEIKVKTTQENPMENSVFDGMFDNLDSFWNFLNNVPVTDMINELIFGKDKAFGMNKKRKLYIGEFVDFYGFDKMAEEERKKFVTAIFDAYGSDIAISELKNAIPNISVDGIIRLTNWDTFTADQRMEFLNSISKSFGSQEALRAAKAAGIDVAQWVAEGLNSKDPEIAAVAKDWTKIIESEKPNVEVDAHLKKNTSKNITDAIEAISPTITAQVALDKSAKNIKNAIEKIKPSVEITIKNLKEVAQNIADAIGKITVNGKKATAKANGGMVNSGDIFIANENGKSEMIGRFGNQTAVANQEQMVEAMARGVQYAQSEQNGLLREQNSLLRAILAKEMNVNLGASSALGRTVKKSLEMYGTMTGG